MKKFNIFLATLLLALTTGAVAQNYLYDMSDTWNNGATTFNAIKMDVTDTASAADSKLLNLQVGSTGLFMVDKTGSLATGGASITSGDAVFKLGDNAGVNKLSVIDSDDAEVFSVESNGVLDVGNGFRQWGIEKGQSNELVINGYQGFILSFKNSILEGQTEAYLFGNNSARRLKASTHNQSYFSIPVYVEQSGTAGYTGIHLDVTETATGSGSNNLMDLQVGSVSKFTVSNAGLITTSDANSLRLESTKIGIGRAGGSGDLEVDGQSTIKFQHWNDTALSDVFHFTQEGVNAELTASSGIQSFISIEPEIDQSGTAGYTGIHLDVTETATGSGSNNLMDLQVGSVSKFRFGANGVFYNGPSVTITQSGSVTAASFKLDSSNTIGIASSIFTLTAADGFDMGIATNAETTGTFNAVSITPTYNQASGDAANTDLLINRTETAVGSGSQYLMDLQVGGVSKESTDNAGNKTLAGLLTLASSYGGASFVDGIAFGDGDTGLREWDDDNLILRVGGTDRWQFISNNGGLLQGFSASGPFLRNIDTSATITTVGPSKADLNTGLGAAAADQLSLIAGGVEGMRIIEDTEIIVLNNGEVFGNMYEYGSSNSITVTTAGTYYGWTTVAGSSVNGMTVDVADVTADHFTATYAGEYYVNIAMSFNAGNSDAIQCAAHVDGAINADAPRFHRTMGAAAALGSATASGIMTLAATEEVSLRCTSDGNGDVIALEDTSISIKRVGD